MGKTATGETPGGEWEELRKLIVSRCVEFRDAGFTLASGKVSNLYIDLRLLTQDPVGIYLIGKMVLEKIYELAPEADCVGGLETGSIPIATSVSLLSHLGKGKQLNAFWVRKRIKDHGMQNLIEGNLPKGSTAVVVDDTITTGGSTLQAIRAVKDSASVVTYAIGMIDRGASQNFKNEDVPYYFFFEENDLTKG